MSTPDALRRAAAHVLVDDVSTPTLDDRSEHHVFRVLRVRDGEVVTVTDGRGAWRVCRAAAGSLRPDGDIERIAPPERPIELYVAIPKADRPEWIVQKATELGAHRIVFLHSERSVVRWNHERARKHLAKLAIVAAEASMQSRRVHVPAVEGPIDAAQVLSSVPVAEPGGRPIGDTDHRLAVGPEGGWTPGEVERSPGAVDLGAHVMRVETAALAAVTLLAAVAGSGGRRPSPSTGGVNAVRDGFRNR